MTAMNALAAPKPVKLRIEDFELLDRAGAFERFRKVELVDGTVVEMNAEYSRHTFAKNELTFRLRLALQMMGSELSAFCEPTLALPPHSLPEPDVIVGRVVSDRDYFRVDDIAIVIEVADTSVDRDLGLKKRMYAASAIPEYWVVEINTRTVHQFSNPRDGEFGGTRALPLDGKLASVSIVGLVVAGEGIVPT